MRTVEAQLEWLDDVLEEIRSPEWRSLDPG